MKDKAHHYTSRLFWDGNRGEGTSSYAGYGREHRVLVDGKPPLDLTADAAFRGDPARLNPEDLFLASLASCHMLSYLALCAREKLSVIAYEDTPEGVMREDGKGGGRFEEVTLRPRVTIADERQRERATELHERAHELCFIASSCNVSIRHEVTIAVAEAQA